MPRRQPAGTLLWVKEDPVSTSKNESNIQETSELVTQGEIIPTSLTWFDAALKKPWMHAAASFELMAEEFGWETTPCARKASRLDESISCSQVGMGPCTSCPTRRKFRDTS